jgi:CRISPR-associated protein Csd1
MILQALNEYYKRKRDYDSNSLPPPGMELVEISFVVILRKDGSFFDFADMREGEGRNKRGKLVNAPQSCDRPGQNAWATAFLLWDHPRYVLGIPTSKDIERNDEQTPLKRLESFKNRILASFPDPTVDDGVNAVFQFLDKADISKIKQHQLWNELQETTGNVSFRLVDEPELLICERPVVSAAVEKELDDATGCETRQCLITGEIAPVAVLHPATPLPSADSKSTAKLVSFQKNSGYDSYGKEQGGNAPVSKRATFAYTAALNHLLARGSRQRIQVGDTFTVFWAEKPGHKVETLFGTWLQDTPDNPDFHAQAVAALLSAPRTGAGSFEDDGTRFYVLGLAPNAARIAIRFWHVQTVGELAINIRNHFDGLEIDRSEFDARSLSVSAILKSISRRKSDGSYDTPPNMAGDTMQAILTGRPYPATLFQAAIRRIRAEQEVNYPRAAIIKACINRYSGREELKVSLDESNTNTAYRLGRLFAVLERIQEEANPGIRATIRNTFWGAASSTPGKVFPRLIDLATKHLSKLRREKSGRAVNLEKLIGSIMDALNPDKPFMPIFSLNDQGCFAVGYYHQKQHPSTYKTQGDEHEPE